LFTETTFVEGYNSVDNFVFSSSGVQQGRPRTINVTMRRVRATIFAAEKQRVLLILNVFVFVVLGIQHSMRMRHTVIYGLPGSTMFLHIIP
jgi:hypothetical protein